MTINDLINELKAKHHLHSDRKVAKFLGITAAAFHKIVHGGGMSDDTAIKIADALDRDRNEVVFIAHAEKAKTPLSKEFWDSVLKRLGTTASVIFSGNIILQALPSSDAQASVFSGISKIAGSELFAQVCILC